MDMFTRRELIKTNDGYTLVLYLDHQNYEFAEEFINKSGKAAKKQSGDFLENIKKYISENYSDKKIDTVKIILGTTVIATIVIGMASISYMDQKSTPAASAAGVSSDEAYGNTAAGQGLTATSSAVGAKVEKDLILVNKETKLSKDYVPAGLVHPDVPSLSASKTRMRPEAAKALEQLFQKAKEDNIHLVAASGYRSYSYQKEVFASNIKKYGSAAAANQFSARPGESEHQTGLAMDVTSPSVHLALTQSFAQTKEGKWLKENAPKYGFILRYPGDKEAVTGYQFEPWHIRYVGTDASAKIAARSITLEEYLG